MSYVKPYPGTLTNPPLSGASSLKFGRRARFSEFMKIQQAVKDHLGEAEADKLNPKTTFVNPGGTFRDFLDRSRLVFRMYLPMNLANVFRFSNYAFLYHYATPQAAEKDQYRLGKEEPIFKRIEHILPVDETHTLVLYRCSDLSLPEKFMPLLTPVVEFGQFIRKKLSRSEKQ